MRLSSRRTFLTAAAVSAAAITIPSARRAFGQQMKTKRTTKMGVVVAVEGQTIYLSTSEGPLTASLGSNVDIWKKNTRRDLSDIVAGDMVLVSGNLNSSGTLVADKVWANIASFYGLIVSVAGNQYEVLLYQPQPNGQRMTVIFDSNVMNAFGAPMPRTDIQVGRFAQTLGVGLPDGRVDATKVVVYGDDSLPLGGGPNPVILDAHGQIVKK
jgi:hypothetical protein